MTNPLQTGEIMQKKDIIEVISLVRSKLARDGECGCSLFGADDSNPTEPERPPVMKYAVPTPGPIMKYAIPMPEPRRKYGVPDLD